MFAIGPNVRGFIPGWRRYISKGDRNPQHVFIWSRSKSFCPMYDFTVCQRTLRSIKEILLKEKLISFASSYCFATRWLVDCQSALMDESGDLLILFHHGSPCSCITWGMNNMPVDGHPIGMIVIKTWTTPLYAQSDGMMEPFMKTVEERTRKVVSKVTHLSASILSIDSGDHRHDARQRCLGGSYVCPVTCCPGSLGQAAVDNRLRGWPRRAASRHTSLSPSTLECGQ
jgi:hypothetical protein